MALIYLLWDFFVKPVVQGAVYPMIAPSSCQILRALIGCGDELPGKAD